MNDGRIHDGETRLIFLVGHHVTQEGGILHMLLVHDPFSGQVHQKIGLGEHIGYGAGDSTAVFHFGNQLNADGGLVRSGIPSHAHTVAHQTGDGKREQILSVGIASLFLDELLIAARAAGGKDGGLAYDANFLTGLIGGDHAADFSVLLEDLLAGSFQQELDTQLQCPGIQRFIHEGRSPGSNALVGLDDMPSGFRLGEIPESALKFHALFFQPFDGLGRLGEIALDEPCVHVVMGVLHEHVEGFFHGDVGHLLTLVPGSDAQGAHAHVGRAAHSSLLLADDDPGAQLGSLHRGTEAGGSTGNDHHIGFILSHRCLLLYASNSMALPVRADSRTASMTRRTLRTWQGFTMISSSPFRALRKCSK